MSLARSLDILLWSRAYHNPFDKKLEFQSRAGYFRRCRRPNSLSNVEYLILILTPCYSVRLFLSFPFYSSPDSGWTIWPILLVFFKGVGGYFFALQVQSIVHGYKNIRWENKGQLVTQLPPGRRRRSPLPVGKNSTLNSSCMKKLN